MVFPEIDFYNSDPSLNRWFNNYNWVASLQQHNKFYDIVVHKAHVCMYRQSSIFSLVKITLPKQEPVSNYACPAFCIFNLVIDFLKASFRGLFKTNFCGHVRKLFLFTKFKISKFREKVFLNYT